jgi:hypothetical protein
MHRAIKHLYIEGLKNEP